MQHISSKDIPAEDFHPPSVCALPLKAVSSFSSVSSSSHISGFLIPSCLRGVGGCLENEYSFPSRRCSFSLHPDCGGTFVTWISMPHRQYLNPHCLHLFRLSNYELGL